MLIMRIEANNANVVCHPRGSEDPLSMNRIYFCERWDSRSAPAVAGRGGRE